MEKDTYSMDMLVVPDIIKIAAETIILLGLYILGNIIVTMQWEIQWLHDN